MVLFLLPTSCPCASTDITVIEIKRTEIMATTRNFFMAISNSLGIVLA